MRRSAVHDVLSTSGSPLDQATRTDMEARLGADFSDVRIHQGGAARASAAEVGARAYTSGNHVVIGEGGSDKHTLAHELTHVIQQRQGPVAGTDNGRGLSVSSPSDRFEREAEANATRVMRSSASLPKQTAAPAESGGGPVEGAIQRRVSLRDAQNPQNTRELSDEQSVREFLEQHGVSILESTKTRMGASLGVTAAVRVELKAGGVIRDFIAAEKDLVYEDSKAGAEELVDAICDRVIRSFAESHGQSAPSIPSAMLRQMNQQQSGGGNPGPSPGGPGHRPLANMLSQWARQGMAEHAAESSFLTGLRKGAESAVTGRTDALTMPVPSSESVSEGTRWAAWVALEGEEKVRRTVEQAAQQVSPEEGQRLLAQFDETLKEKKKEMAGTVVGSAVTSGLIGQAANAIPNPGIKLAAKLTSTILGGLATAKQVGDGADAVKKIEEVSPQTYKTLLNARDEALSRAADEYLVKSRENTMEQLMNSGNFQ
ncbi:DUF4157 domain-containing protein [Streptomyces sp. NPDC046931]|uniref:eCIS core domain-containing protein n=1 Tax=Streptomyces sp. NPDC046931 TaxID=3154806 RepID=UPI0033E6B7F5